jgi:hypothetical protein
LQAPSKRRCARLQVNLSIVRTSDQPTGTAFICVSDDAENAITVAPGANLSPWGPTPAAVGWRKPFADAARNSAWNGRSLFTSSRTATRCDRGAQCRTGAETACRVAAPGLISSWSTKANLRRCPVQRPRYCSKAWSALQRAHRGSDPGCTAAAVCTASGAISGAARVYRGTIGHDRRRRHLLRKPGGRVEHGR